MAFQERPAKMQGTRELIIKRHLEGLTGKQIALRMDLKQDYVYSVLSRFRSNLAAKSPKTGTVSDAPGQARKRGVSNPSAGIRRGSQGSKVGNSVLILKDL